MAKRSVTRAGCVAAAMAVVACGPSFGQASKPQPVVASTTLVADRGRVVFADDFKNTRSGWTTGTSSDGTRTAYTDSGFVVIANKKTVDHVLHSPYAAALPQISVSVTATTGNSPKGSAPGVGCSRGPGEKTIKYTFVDTRPGAKAPATVLKRGVPPSTPGLDPIVVEGMCATLADGKSTRLIFFVNGIEVADVTDKVADLPAVGWFGDLIIRGQKAAVTTVTVTHFEVRNLVV
jgi:hypothetical protein